MGSILAPMLHLSAVDDPAYFVVQSLEAGLAMVIMVPVDTRTSRLYGRFAVQFPGLRGFSVTLGGRTRLQRLFSITQFLPLLQPPCRVEGCKSVRPKVKPSEPK